MIETRPSGAGRWYQCTAAPQFAAANKRPPADNDAAREGTCAAWVAELALKEQVLRCADLIGELHENGWEVTAEMAADVQAYVDMIRARGGVIEAERFVRLSDRVAGTLDCSAEFIGNVLYIDDLKYGFRLVPPTSPQLLCYAAGVVAEMDARGASVTAVQTGIYQPRGFSRDGIYRTKRWTASEIREWGARLIDAAERCHQPNPIATPGPHCRDCHGAIDCEALALSTYAAFDVIRSGRVLRATGPVLSKELTFLRNAKAMLDARLSAVEAEAAARIRDGEFVPGWKIGTKQGNRRPRRGLTPGVFKMLTGIDPRPDDKFASMTVLRSRGAKDVHFNTFYERPETAPALMEYDPADTAAQFKENDE